MIEINPVIIELLSRRGISGEDEIAEFLSEKPQTTYDPFLLLNMEAGVDLILSAARRNKKICIYGDYDADGITSICLLTQTLSHLTKNLTYYVPSRFDEGYGLNNAAIESIHKGGAELIITVDCGSVSYEEAEYAKKLGLEIVITDHHSINDVIADCIVINPKQPGCAYPFKQLAGVGVAFKLAQAIQQRAGLPKHALTDVLDLVAIGTIGDIVPLVDENRTLSKYGMRELNRLKRKGMAGLAEAVFPQKSTITSDKVAFIIVPHINSVGRMINADSAVDLLISEDEAAIKENVGKLIECNRERKKVQDETYKQCVEIVDRHLASNKFLMICPPDGHEGVAGIAAGMIKDKYNKPAVIITPSGDMCKGTGRSIEKVNLYELLGNFRNLFSKFGGHAAACGFLMRRADLSKLKYGLEEKMNEIYECDPHIFDEPNNFDMRLSGRDVTVDLGETLECLAPFGRGNRKPVFRIDGVSIRDAAVMGEDGRHLKFAGYCRDGGILQCVLFNKAEEFGGAVNSGRLADIFGTVDVQEWNGNKRVQFQVERVMARENADDIN